MAGKVTDITGNFTKPFVIMQEGYKHDKLMAHVKLLNTSVKN